MLGPFATTRRLTPIHQMSLAVLSRAACASMSTTTTTTRDRRDCYGPMEWAQSINQIIKTDTQYRDSNDKYFSAGLVYTVSVLMMHVAVCSQHCLQHLNLATSDLSSLAGACSFLLLKLWHVGRRRPFFLVLQLQRYFLSIPSRNTMSLQN